jgi:hypothetical protein
MKRTPAIATVAVAGLVLVGCGADAGVPYRFRAVPASEWPSIPGVEVVDASSTQGHSCCEPQDGSLSVRLNLPAHHPYVTLKEGLRAAGWVILKCDFHRPGHFYFARDGLDGYADTNKRDRSGADLFIYIQRGGDTSHFQPTNC